MTPSLLRQQLEFLYGPAVAHTTLPRLHSLMARYREQMPQRAGTLTERDALLITYADQVTDPAAAPLATLHAFAQQHLRGVVSGLHLLPFYPWTSDDGFAVVDYRTIDPALGTWAEVQAFSADFRLMFDAVINHLSTQSAWFQAFLRDEAPYGDYFVTWSGEPEAAVLTQVVRPRALPLLTAFTTPSGVKQVWTTFSADQVDINVANPEVLLELVEVLLLYATQGADFIRLDAIAYLWKEIGTTCIHLPQTHRVIQLFRTVLNLVAPHVKLITETNVPHADNISYFGNGENEAQLVYNFALPPLTLHTFRTGDAQALTQWAATLTLPSTHTTFFNFLASHDGIGLNPARGILPVADIEALVAQTLAHGGLVSYKHNPDGTQSVYELNINYFDALSNPAAAEPLAQQIARFLAAQAILLALVGMPGIYFHSLFGSRSWPEGVKLTGRNRTINRQKHARVELEAELADATSLRAQVFSRYRRLLQARAASPAFHPHGVQAVVAAGAGVFALWRGAVGAERVLCLHNVTATPQSVAATAVGLQPGVVQDLITQTPSTIEDTLALAPYQVLWLRV